eukprot:CAMPEP_0119302914 /NCGR_PEP_ID=MMETSP1333-20130426/4436_1 /TAXON_ID=418940 /ORGANISM="Scyphosphaera apsteinii, Strain RCC1455" /LENGTH=150 /DNA_ID=CAMNT_0007305433 /DNA_START=1 /DNA_END=449 /DNA_ORIENTATION=+
MGRGRGDAKSISLYVRNLGLDVMPDQVRELFQKHGHVKDVYLPKDFHTKQPRGFAYVEFLTEDDALEAMESLNGIDFQGRQITVAWAEGNRKSGVDMMRQDEARTNWRRDSGYSRRSDDRRHDDRYDDRRHDDRRYDDRRYDDRRYDDRR